MSDTDVTVDPSTTTDDNQADSSNADDSKSDSSSHNEEFVPYERFKEVISDKNEAKEQLDSLTTEFADFKSKFTPQEAKEEIPDYYENPEAHAKYIEDRTYNRIMSEQSAKTDAQTQAEKLINNQFEEIRKEDKDVNEDKVCEFADTYGITSKETGAPDLVAAHKLMKQLADKDDTKRAETAPVSTNSSTASTGGNPMTRQQLKNVSYDALIAEAAREKG